MLMNEHKLQRRTESKLPEDLQVTAISDCLHDKKIDVIVAGSIGAVEAPRLLRALRRLGAEVHPWLTEGGAQFITPLALSWAAANPCKTKFEESASHIATGDACVIAPASANFIEKIARGVTDSPDSALVASYLGQKKKVLVVPNMHTSLLDSPMVQENIQKLKKYLHFLEPRKEEGKAKFPEPDVLADSISHEILRRKENIFISMGSMRGYLDDVRFLSNYSSGGLGTAISEELFRNGFLTTVAIGPCEIKPKSYDERLNFETFEELRKIYQSASKFDGGVLLASILDYVPKKRVSGKVKSGAKNLQIDLRPTEKLIESLNFKNKLKVGFKLEADINEKTAKAIATEYMKRYKLSLCVVNSKKEVSATEHKAFLFSQKDMESGTGKSDIARKITRHLIG